MPDCDYCSDTFDDERGYYKHLDSEHAAELGSIDQRRVDEYVESDSGFRPPIGPLILVGVIGFGLVLVVYLTVFLGNDSALGPSGTVNGIDVAATPTEVGSVHHHGPMNVTIDGEQLDFSRSEFQRPRTYPAFHFESGDGSTWHGHARGITLQYAMATLGINVTESSVTYEGTTYRDSDPETSVRIRVDGEEVDPSTYTLTGPGNVENAADGDRVRIVVTTDG